MLHWVVADSDEIFRVNLWPTDFAGREGMLEVNLTDNLVDTAKAGSRGFAETIIENLSDSTNQEDVVASNWSSINVDGVDGVAVEIRMKRGELTLHDYRVFAVGEDKALSLSMGFAVLDRKRTRERVEEIVANFRWSD